MIKKNILTAFLKCIHKEDLPCEQRDHAQFIIILAVWRNLQNSRGYLLEKVTVLILNLMIFIYLFIVSKREYFISNTPNRVLLIKISTCFEISNLCLPILVYLLHVCVLKMLLRIIFLLNLKCRYQQICNIFRL